MLEIFTPKGVYAHPWWYTHDGLLHGSQWNLAQNHTVGLVNGFELHETYVWQELDYQI